MEPDLRFLTIACDITTFTTSVVSPKHVGLAVTLHHDYGSHKLIENIHMATVSRTRNFDEQHMWHPCKNHHLLDHTDNQKSRVTKMKNIS